MHLKCFYILDNNLVYVYNQTVKRLNTKEIVSLYNPYFTRSFKIPFVCYVLGDLKFSKVVRKHSESSPKDVSGHQ
jgi:hypothetical protein